MACSAAICDHRRALVLRRMPAASSHPLNRLMMKGGHAKLGTGVLSAIDDARALLDQAEVPAAAAVLQMVITKVKRPSGSAGTPGCCASRADSPAHAKADAAAAFAEAAASKKAQAETETAAGAPGDIGKALSAVAAQRSWLHGDKRVHDIVDRLAAAGITSGAALREACALQQPEAGRPAPSVAHSRHWNRSGGQCDTTQTCTRSPTGESPTVSLTVSRACRCQPQRTFRIGREEVVVRQETDEAELHQQRERMPEYGGVGMVAWKAGNMLAECDPAFP